MKKIAFIIGLSLSTTLSFAQDTAQMVIDNYYEAIGGKEAWLKIEGFKMTGTAAAQGMDFPFSAYTMKNGNSITQVSFQGIDIVQDAFDGTTAWGTNFMSGKAEAADSETTENKKRTIGEFPDAYLNAEKLGYSFEYLGKEVVDGVSCYKLKINKGTELVGGEEKERVEYNYFDEETFAQIMTEQEISSGPMKGGISQSVFSDYQEVDGLYFPFSITYRMKDGEGQTITIDKIEINPKVEKGMFSMPKQ